MRYIGEYKFIGADGSMGIRRNKDYYLEVDKNIVYVYKHRDNDSETPVQIPYTVEGFLSNWRDADIYEI